MAENALVFRFAAAGENTVVRSLEKVDRAIGKLGETLKTATKAALAISGGLAAGAFAEGFSNALDVSDARAKLTAQLDLSAGDSEKLGKVAGDLFTNAYGDSLDEVNEALKRVIQDTNTSVNAVNLKPLTGKVISVSKAFDQDLGGVTRGISQLMRTGLAKNADQALDVVAYGFSTGADKADDLLDTLNEYGTQFRKLGLGGGQAIDIINQGLQAGARDADTVADALKEFAIRAVDGSKLTAQGFKDLGLNASVMIQAIGKGGDRANEALDTTLDKLRGIKDPVEQSRVAVALFGTKAEDLGQALFALDPSKAVKSLDKLAGAATRVDKTLGATPRSTITKYSRILQNGLTTAVGEGLQSLEDLWSTFGPRITAGLAVLGKQITAHLPTVDWGMLGTNLQTAAEDWGKALLPGIRTGLDKGDWSSLGKTLGNGLAKGINSGASALGDILKTIGRWFASVDWVGLGIEAGKQAIPLLVGFAIGLANVDLLDLLSDLADHWQAALIGIITLALTPAKIIGPVAKILAKIPLVGPFLAWGLRALKGLSDGLVSGVWRALKFLGDAFLEGFARVFPSVGKGFAEWIGLLPTRLGVWAIEAGEAAQRFVQGIADGILSGIHWVVSAIGELVGYIVRPFAKAGTMLLRVGVDLLLGLLRGIGSVIGRIAGVWATVIRAIMRPFARAGGWLIRTGADILSGLLQGALSKLGALGRGLSRVGATVLDRFKDAGKWLVSKGGSLISGLFEGAVNAVKGAASWAKRIGGEIVDAVKDFFGISSPSKVFAELGGHLITGLVHGMIKANPVKMVSRIFGGMTEALNSMVGGGLIDAAKLSVKALAAMQPTAGAGSTNQSLAKLLAQSYGWSGGLEWEALNQIVSHESGWNNNAQNPTSTAYGLFQFLDSTWSSVGAKKTSDPAAQIMAGLKYIKSRYGDPLDAWDFWRVHHWYGSGGVIPEPVLGVGLRSGKGYGFGENGPETVIPGVPGGGRGGDVHIHVHNHGVIGSERDVDNWLVRSMDRLSRARRLPALGG